MTAASFIYQPEVCRLFTRRTKGTKINSFCGGKKSRITSVLLKLTASN